MKTYAAYYDNDIRRVSSSGGLFSLLASKFDVIYGVALSNDCYRCEFVRCENDITPLRSSKYFQAKTGDTFKQVRKDLTDGKKVLFSGTGCQINGLSAFLGKEFDNLFLLEIICHGTPSQKFWEKYIEFQEKKYRKISSVNFRCKEYLNQKYTKKCKELYIPKTNDDFMYFFLKDLCLRPSCYECHAKDYKKSDMTIGDFWGIESIDPSMNDLKGTSLVITRTDKGQSLFEVIKDELIWKEFTYEEGVSHNPSEYRSVKKPVERDNFYKEVNSMSFRKLTNKYIYGPWWKRAGRKIKHILKGNKANEEIVRKTNMDYGMLFTFKK